MNRRHWLKPLKRGSFVLVPANRAKIQLFSRDENSGHANLCA